LATRKTDFTPRDRDTNKSWPRLGDLEDRHGILKHATLFVQRKLESLLPCGEYRIMHLRGVKPCKHVMKARNAILLIK